MTDTHEETDQERLRHLVVEGLYTDGAHHKQWFLWEIGKLVKDQLLTDQDYELYGEPDPGIAP